MTVTEAEVLVPVRPDLSEFESLLEQKLEAVVSRAAEQFAAAITITVTEDAPASAPPPAPIPWHGVLVVEGELTRDNSPTPRLMPPDVLTWRNLPIPLLVMRAIIGKGHDGHELVGRIDAIERMSVTEFLERGYELDSEGMPKDGNVLYATGIIHGDENGQKTAELMEEKVLRGVSIDIVSGRFSFAKLDTLEIVDEAELSIDELLSGDYVVVLTQGEIGGATIAPLQAIGTASVSLVACGVDTALLESTRIALLEPAPAAVTAAAPLVRPKRVYFRPEPDVPTPLTVTEEGEVYGHLFVKGSCHVGFQHRCLMPQPSPTDYAHFNLSPVPTAEGEDVMVGQLTMDTDHAAVAPGVTPDDVWRHYSNTGCAVADVRIVNGRLGGWVSGALRDVGEAAARTLKCAKMSGDWRRKPEGLDLIGVLAVNVPGYEVPQPRAWVTASAAGEEVEALVAAGIVFDEHELEMAELFADLVDAEPCEECEEMVEVEVSFSTNADLLEMDAEGAESLYLLVAELAAEKRRQPERERDWLLEELIAA